MNKHNNITQKTNQISNTDPKQQLSDWLVQSLLVADLNCYFGIPGGAIEPLTDAISRNSNNDVKLIVCKHEGAAGFMADGHYRETGIPAICFATTGPGATNLSTGIASAYVDSIPLLVITAQSNSQHFGRGALQDSSDSGIDIVSSFRPFTRYSSLVCNQHQLPHKLSRALNILQGDSPGPVHLSIPMNVLREPIQLNADPLVTSRIIAKPAQTFCDEAINNVVELIIKYNKHVTFLIGERVHAIADTIYALCKQYGSQVVVTPRSKGLIDPNTPGYRGVLGLAGHASASNALHAKNCDLILALGTSMDEQSTANWDDLGVFSDRVIHVDNDPSKLDYFSPAIIKLCADPSRFINDVLNRLPKRCALDHLSRNDEQNINYSNEKNTYTNNLKNNLYHQEVRDHTNTKQAIIGRTPQKILPADLVQRLSSAAPKGTHLYADSGNAFLWAIHHWHIKLPDNQDNTFHVGLGYSSMGWAIGAAIGAATHRPNHPILCLTGDGATLMHTGELATAVQYNLSVIFVILNDQSYGTVKHGQRMAGAEQIGFQLPAINFALLAESMGIKAFRINNAVEFSETDLLDIFALKGPVVLDICIDSEVPPPLSDRLSALGTAPERDI